MNADKETQARRTDAMARFVETIARIRTEQFNGAAPRPLQANAENITALNVSAATLRAKAAAIRTGETNA